MFRPHMQFNQMILSMLLGPAELLVSTDTVHVEDYSKIVADALDGAATPETGASTNGISRRLRKGLRNGRQVCRAHRNLIEQNGRVEWACHTPPPHPPDQSPWIPLWQRGDDDRKTQRGSAPLHAPYVERTTVGRVERSETRRLPVIPEQARIQNVPRRATLRRGRVTLRPGTASSTPLVPLLGGRRTESRGTPRDPRPGRLPAPLSYFILHSLDLGIRAMPLCTPRIRALPPG